MTKGSPGGRATDCFVCDKHRKGDAAEGGVLYDDELVYAGHVHGAPAAYRGWLVVEPTRHAVGLGDLTDSEASALGVLVSRLARVLMETTGAEHIYAFVYGDAIPHLHIHLAPRYPDTPREYWGPKLNEWPDAQGVDKQQMSELIASLRVRL